MNEQLFIPEKINVGYQNRSDTYTKKLAYVIYWDNKGVLRKEKSWESWRDKKIEPNAFANEPTEGFVINRNGGGKGSGWGWNDRMEFVRVFDPRGHEFEISLPNLLYILQETNSIKGKGLEGEFVYAWAGTTLCLLPVNSAEYKKCQVYTKLQDESVSAKELVAGLLYETKRQEKLIYLGKFPNYGRVNYYYAGSTLSASMDYVFVKPDSIGKTLEFESFTDTKTIAKVLSDVCHPEFANMVDDLLSRPTFGKIKGVSSIHAKINFVEEYDHSNRYSYGDPSGMSGQEYKRRMKKEPALEQKYTSTFYKKVSENTWQIISLYRVRKELEGKDDYHKENYFSWKHEGYRIKSSKIVVFENNELKTKSSKFQDDTLYSKHDIVKLDLLQLQLILNNDKTHNLA